MNTCPGCKGNGTIPTKCPRCFGSGKEEPGHTLFRSHFRDHKTLIALDNPRNIGLLVESGDSFHFDNIYIDKCVDRELKCTLSWYLSRFGRQHGK